MQLSISSFRTHGSRWRWLASALLLGSLASMAGEGPLLDDPNGAVTRTQALEEAVQNLSGDFEIYREHFRKMVKGSQIGFLNAFYGKFGFALIAPRASTFVNLPYNYGLGLYLGVGRYLGRNNVVELELANDAYLAATLRYRFEFHVINPNFSFGPVLGFRAKVTEAIIKKQFLNEAPRKSYVVLGGFVGIPVGRTIILVEIDYVVNRQAILYLNAGIQMFF